MPVQSEQLVEVAYELVGPLVFAPVPPMQMRVEDDGSGRVLLSFPDPGRVVRRHALNPTAAAVYRMLDGERSVGEIIHMFAAQFPDQTPVDLARDILFCVQDMRRKEIIAPVVEESRA